MESENLKQLNLIVKADVQGSSEAIKQSLEKLSNDEVKVKVIGINEAGKVSLSIKKAVDNPQPQKSRPAKRDDNSRPNVWEPKKQPPMSELSFEDMISRFKQNSEERMCDLKRSTDRKNGTRRK